MPSDYKPFGHRDLTYKLENYPSHTALPHDRIDSAIAGAFAKWQAVSLFTFTKTTSNSADIRLSFGSVQKPDAGAQANQQTHTIVFDDKRTWLDLAEELRAKLITTGVLGGVTLVSGPLAPVFGTALVLVRGIWEAVDAFDPNRPDVLSIAVHEIGHALGLADNTNPASVMQSTADYYKMTNVNGAPIPQADIDELKEANGHLYSDYYATHGVTEWFKRGEGFVQVSAGLDNTVWAIDKLGRARKFSPNNGHGDLWETFGDKMRQIAVFNDELVLAVTETNELALYKPPPLLRPQNYNAWPIIARGAKVWWVAVGAQASVWAGGPWVGRLRPASQIKDIADFKTSWLHLHNNINCVWLAVGSGPQGKGEQVWAMSSLGLCTWDHAESLATANDGGIIPYGWVGVTPPPQDTHGKVAGCDIGDDGTVVIFTVGGPGAGLYRVDDDKWTKLPAPPGRLWNISVVSKTNMWCVVENGDIYSTLV